MGAPPLRTAETARARELIRQLGIGSGTAVGRLKWRGPGLETCWHVEKGRLHPWRLANALCGGTGLDVRGLDRIAFLTFDLDVHGADFERDMPREVAEGRTGLRAASCQG